jgi:hypothetical protein
MNNDMKCAENYGVMIGEAALRASDVIHDRKGLTRDSAFALAVALVPIISAAYDHNRAESEALRSAEVAARPPKGPSVFAHTNRDGAAGAK